MEDNDDNKKGGDTSDGRMYKGGDNHENGRSTGFTGTVTAISGSTIAIKSNRDNTTYNVVTANAKIYKGPTVKTLADIKVGDFVIVEGSMQADKFMATRILDTQFDMKFPENGKWDNFKPGIIGTVSAVSGTTLTVTAKDGTVYTVATADAKFQKEKGTASTINEVKVGDTVLIQGTVNGTSVTAKNVFDSQIALQKIETKMDKMENNNGNHNGFFVRFGNFFRNIFKGKASASVNSSIAGNTYRLTSFNGTLVANDQNYTATFKDGKLSAKFCNSMNGSYSLKDGVVTAQLTSTTNTRM
jgi:preprotein translocase subunit YajC